MAFVRNPLEEPEKSLRDYASPWCEDIKVQESDLVLQATRYEIKPQIIEISNASRRYAIQYVKRESLMIGLNGISSPTHLLMKKLSGIHSRPSKSREIGINW
jgi:hypothetical protein